ncbi:hypothetical protein Dimus_034142 [Dionaea muscipula]
MRNQWRLLLRLHSAAKVSNPLSLHQVLSPSSPQSLPPSLLLPLAASHHPSTPSTFQIPSPRHFSSEISVNNEVSDHSLVIEIFSKSTNNDEIQHQLESNNVNITDYLLLNVLEDLKSNPDTAVKFFDWVSAREGERLSSKGYDLMLGILGRNGLVKEFWDLIGVVKKKGFRLSKDTFCAVEEYFQREGLENDLDMLRILDLDTEVESVVPGKVSGIIRDNVWDEDVEKRIRELNAPFSSDLIATVLENLRQEPSKALIFFRWVDESGLFKHDEKTYNAMALVLGRGDCVDRFWNLVREMRDAGYEMEMATYIEALSDFVGMRMMRDAVDLYDFAMAACENKPPSKSSSDCTTTFLLKSIISASVDQLDMEMELFSKVVKVFTDSGNVLEDSHVNAVFKSLKGLGRVGDCSKIMEVMAGSAGFRFRPSSALQGKMAFWLSSLGEKDGARKLMETLEASSGCKPDSMTWTSLIQGHCVAGNLDEASRCFENMVEILGMASGSAAVYAFQVLVTAYCRKNEAVEAFRLLCNMVTAKDLKPSHPTYKILIIKLLVQNCFEYAVQLLPLMKIHGFPPFVDPFIKHVSMRGTVDDAMRLLTAIKIKKSTSNSVILRMFEAFSKAGRFDEAQNLLAICPRYIRNNADVLDLFASMMMSQKAVSLSPAAAVASQ